MAGKKAAKVSKKIVGIPDLCEEFGMEGTRVRTIIRGMGISAPAVEGVTGFGPRSKYAFEEGSAELKQIRKVLAEKAAVAKDAPPKVAKAKKAKAAPPVEDDEDEDDDDDDEDDEDDDE